MDLQFVPYDPQYDIEIVHCLQRNYPWMGRRSDSYMRQWISPVLDNRFGGEENDPGKHALLVMDGDHVVGFLGRIVANWRGLQTDNWTTWCIDQDYRLATFYGVQQILTDTDVNIYTNLTANDSMRKILERFEFRLMPGQTVTYKISGGPGANAAYRLLRTAEDAQCISNPEMRVAYLDHLPYDVRCVTFVHAGQEEYLFLKAYRRRGIVENLLMGKFVRILACTVHELPNDQMDVLLASAARCMHSRKVECDESILRCQQSAYTQESQESIRFYRGDAEKARDNWSYLYTELALLDE